MTPLHLKDLIRLDGDSGPLAQSLAAFINVVIKGSIPDMIQPLFFGARLIAFNKKDGGLRPIAVGLTLRRVAAKVLASIATPLLQSTFLPFQLGVGIPRGLEAGVHASRLFFTEPL